jgi:hypothetical protein
MDAVFEMIIEPMAINLNPKSLIRNTDNSQISLIEASDSSGEYGTRDRSFGRVKITAGMAEQPFTYKVSLEPP